MMDFVNETEDDFNQPTEYPEETLEMLSQLTLLCSCVMNVMCVAGVVGNSLSLYIYTRKTFRKRSINILLSALSASDLCVCILAIPVFSLSQLQQMMPGMQLMTATVMLYFYPVTLMFQTMSVWMLVSITVDRYLAVCHPFIVQSYCTRSRALLTVALIVLFSVAYNFVRFWEYGVADTKHDAGVEELLEPVLRGNPMYMLWYQNVATLLSQFVLPLLVLCIFNLEVARTILAAGEQRRQLVASERREHSTAKMMLFVVIVFIFCYTFSFILNITEILDEGLFRGPVGYLLNDINNILIVVNSSSSFIFYVTYSTRYRSQLRQIWGFRYIAERWQCCFLNSVRLGNRSNSTDFSIMSVTHRNSSYYGSYSKGSKKNPQLAERLLKHSQLHVNSAKTQARVSFENVSNASGKS